MSEIAVFSENQQVTFELLSEACKWKTPLGAECSAVVTDAAAANDCFAYGADKVYVVKSSEFFLDSWADALDQVVKKYGVTTLLLASTKRGKELAPRVAHRLNAGCITDAIGAELVDKKLVFQRYTLGGNTISSESVNTQVQVISVMPRAFKLAEKQAKQGQVITADIVMKSPAYKVLEKKPKAGTTVNLEEAKTLVCIGRGLNKKEDLSIIEELAKLMKAELGCTRPIAYDLHWLPEEREVGLSGKKCKPDLSMIIGISGQIQHTVGIRDSKIIVAINKDKNAPIFHMSDYGIVGDLYEIIPGIVKKLKG
jgi:electron transfer flavoprotein alpha subunit